MAGKRIVVLLIGTLFSGTGGTAGTLPIADVSFEASSLPLLRRVIVLPLPPATLADARTTQIVTDQRARRRQRGRRKPRRLPAAALAGSGPALPALIPPREQGKAKSKPRAPAVSSSQMPALAQGLFNDAFVERLRQRARTVIVSGAEVEMALHDLRLTALDALETEAGRRLCARLNADALFAPRLTSVVVTAQQIQRVTLRGTLSITLPAANVNGPRNALPPTLPLVGTAAIGRSLLGSGYVKPTLQLVQEAATQAAALAAGAIKRGEAAPLTRPDERVAVLPVLAPATADALLLTPQGRRVVAAYVQTLPTDVSSRFVPDLSPLSEQAIVSPVESRRGLRIAPETLPAIWQNENAPDVQSLQRAGKRLGVDYVLLARISEIELEEERPVVLTRSARAEANAVFVRVHDGALLWQERTTATMTARPVANRPSESASDVIADAERFALLEMERRFHRFRASYER